MQPCPNCSSSNCRFGFLLFYATILHPNRYNVEKTEESHPRRQAQYVPNLVEDCHGSSCNRLVCKHLPTSTGKKIYFAISGVAIAGGEDLGSLIDLVGAIFFSSLGFLVPAVLDIIVTYQEDWGAFYWKLIKNLFIILVALFALVSGSYYAILDMTK